MDYWYTAQAFTHDTGKKRVPSFEQRKEKTMTSSLLTNPPPPPISWMEFDLFISGLGLQNTVPSLER